MPGAPVVRAARTGLFGARVWFMAMVGTRWRPGAGVAPVIVIVMAPTAFAQVDHRRRVVHRARWVNRHGAGVGHITIGVQADADAQFGLGQGAGAGQQPAQRQC